MFSYIVYNYTWSVFDVIVVMQKKRSGFGVGDARHQAIIKKTAARPRDLPRDHAANFITSASNHKGIR